MQTRLTILILMAGFMLTACDPSAAENPDKGSDSTAPRNQDIQQILRGGRIYQQNCAVCHGKLAQGAENWRQRDAQGKFPPPPLNGTAHTWHHPTAQLVDVIKNGTIRLGGNMPPWKDKLSDQDIEDVLAWITAQWPDEIYAEWYRLDQQAKANKQRR